MLSEFNVLACRCGHVVGRERDGRLKIEVRSRLVAVTKSGQAEINCPRCKKVVRLPLFYDDASNNGGNS